MAYRWLGAVLLVVRMNAGVLCFTLLMKWLRTHRSWVPFQPGAPFSICALLFESTAPKHIHPDLSREDMREYDSYGVGIRRM